MFFRLKNRILFALLPCCFMASPAAAWELSSVLISPKDNKAPYHSITFQHREKKISYSPSKPPLGLVFQKFYTFEGETYFVTGWPSGAAVMMFRIFAPGLSRNKPLCEVGSYSNIAELKREMGKIKVSVARPGDKEMRWVSCP